MLDLLSAARRGAPSPQVHVYRALSHANYNPHLPEECLKSDRSAASNETNNRPTMFTRRCHEPSVVPSSVT
eukprot:8050720-Pyramimonas_sp.AAC.2